MANFNISLSDLISGKSFGAKINSEQKNYTPSGEAKALATSESKELMPKKGLTTANISDILQNQLTIKDKGMVSSQFNEVLSQDMSKLLGMSIENVNTKMSRSLAGITGYDIPMNIRHSQLLLDGISSVPPNGSGPASKGDSLFPAVPTPSGFVFPISATKSIIREGLEGAKWSSTSSGNTHHSYNAADIFVPTGTTVVAAMGGKVISANNNGGSFGSSVRIEGQDGYWYYYTHMGVGTVGVSSGQQVVSGAVLGKIGLSKDAQNTTPHLHFDISPQENSFMRGYGGAKGPLINPQPWLIEAFQLLPE